MTPTPAVFVSHGAPTLAIEPSPAREFLSGYGLELEWRFGKPRAILVVSAHWETEIPTLSTAGQPATIHDFGGFPDALYRLRYPAPGAPELARESAALLAAAGFEASLEPDRGLDHGVWIPLLLMFPNADIPVTQLSIQPRLGPEHHSRVGETLRGLRDQGVLFLGSGQVTHNLSDLSRYRGSASPPSHIEEFVAWLEAQSSAGDREALLDYRRRAPYAARNHPTEEHLLPFFVVLGAASPREVLRRAHVSSTFGILRMDVYETAGDLGR